MTARWYVMGETPRRAASTDQHRAHKWPRPAEAIATDVPVSSTSRTPSSTGWMGRDPPAGEGEGPVGYRDHGPISALSAEIGPSSGGMVALTQPGDSRRDRSLGSVP